MTREEMVRKGLFTALALVTWMLLVVVVGMVAAVAADPSVIGLVQLGIAVVLLYPLVPLYRAVEGSESVEELVEVVGSWRRLAVVVVVFLWGAVPAGLPGRSIVGFPLFNAPSLLYPAVIEARWLFGRYSRVFLSFAVLWFQMMWSYLLADAGYGLVTAGFKRRSTES